MVCVHCLGALVFDPAQRLKFIGDLGQLSSGLISDLCHIYCFLVSQKSVRDLRHDGESCAMLCKLLVL